MSLYLHLVQCTSLRMYIFISLSITFLPPLPHKILLQSSFKGSGNFRCDKKMFWNLMEILCFPSFPCLRVFVNSLFRCHRLMFRSSSLTKNWKTQLLNSTCKLLPIRRVEQVKWMWIWKSRGRHKSGIFVDMEVHRWPEEAVSSVLVLVEWSSFTCKLIWAAPRS